MSKTVYIGRKNRLVGKTIFEILCRLRGFGIGRILTRNSLKEEWSGEDNFYRIYDVEPQMDEELFFGRVWVHEIFRSRRYPNVREIQPYHPDYELIPKHLEPNWESYPLLGRDTDHVKIVPREISVPPVMAEYMNRRKLGFFPNITLKDLNKERDGYDRESLKSFNVPSVYPLQEEDPEEFSYWYRIAEEGEQPNYPKEGSKLVYPPYREGIGKVETKPRLFPTWWEDPMYFSEERKWPKEK